MNEIKRCSLSGVGFTFEADAYKRLSDYLDKLNAIYKDSADSAEILADIEARIAELILSAQSSTECVVALPLVENIIAQLGSDAFPRVRIGVGEKPHPEYNLADWVLSNFSAQESEQLQASFETVKVGVEKLLTGDLAGAMQYCNGK